MIKTLNKGIRIFLFVLFLSIIAALFQFFGINKILILIFVSISALFYYSIIKFKNLGFFLSKGKIAPIEDNKEAIASIQFFRPKNIFLSTEGKLIDLISEGPEITPEGLVEYFVEMFDKTQKDIIEIKEFPNVMQDKIFSSNDKTSKYAEVELYDRSLYFVPA